MVEFSFGFTEASFLQLNGQKHLRSVAVMSKKELNEFIRNSQANISQQVLTLSDFCPACDNKYPRGGGGVPAVFLYEGVRMEGKIQTQKYGFPESFAPKNLAHLLPKNMDDNCVLVINSMARDYF